MNPEVYVAHVSAPGDQLGLVLRDTCMLHMFIPIADPVTNEMIKAIRTPQLCQLRMCQPLTQVIGMGLVFEIKFLKGEGDEVVGGKVEALDILLCLE